MPKISLEITLEPRNPEITCTTSIDKENATLTVEDYKMNVKIKPDKSAVVNGMLSGNILGSFLTAGISGIDAISGGALVNKISDTVNDKVQDLLNSNLKGFTYTMPISSSLSHSFDINGVKINISPSELALEQHEGYLMICGGINIG